MAATDYCDYWVWRRYQYTCFSVRRAGQGCRWALSQQQNNFCSNVDGGTGEALSKTLTSCRLLMCVFLIKPSDPDSMRVAWQYSIFYWDLCSQLSIVQLNWHLPENTSTWQVHHCSRFHLTKKSRFTLSFCDRGEKVWKSCDKHYAFWFESGWPVCIGSYWGTNALMPLIYPHIPQTWILLRASEIQVWE